MLYNIGTPVQGGAAYDWHVISQNLYFRPPYRIISLEHVWHRSLTPGMPGAMQAAKPAAAKKATPKKVVKKVAAAKKPAAPKAAPAAAVAKKVRTQGVGCYMQSMTLCAHHR
jgi:hypothetical protein